MGSANLTFGKSDDIIQCVSENLELLRLPCSAHRLQLVVNDGIEDTTAALTKLQNPGIWSNFLMSLALDARFKFQWITDHLLLSDLTKNNIISTIKQYIVDASIQLNSKDNIINAGVQVMPKEASNNKTITPFSDKENKKCLFPALKIGSFKKATSTPVERVFPQSGLLMRPHRSKFSQANVCILTSLQYNKTVI
ncbi:unnamed protein product [Didymodactylos carnosus]|uniref:Uncharacterized protein n=1 Tax=Didymodactylos carnosus TaxID=1234261 RepID=A0A815CDZ0_9BILA|nr:unnamed protein product [Didymodactylos carnosus]CAF1282351.1 unnamed protein product [Didymodactylos carnosus]CAF3814367.1 unnamed protein product [Didymodactylos carnosus]CAF4078596.1 unnamed protein product [Didymodactylos carnosus]